MQKLVNEKKLQNMKEGISLYDVIRRINRMFAQHEKNNVAAPKTPLYESILQNENEIKSSFSSSCDLTIHHVTLKGADGVVISIDNMVSKDIMSQAVLHPLYSYTFTGSGEKCIDDICTKVLFTDDITIIDTFEQLYTLILSGFAVIGIEGSRRMVSVGVQGYRSRSISEPESDIIQRGSRESFVEPVRTNMSMLRRRMKTPSLTFEMMTIGNVSKTEVCLCYLRDTVSDDVLNEVRKRLNKADIDTVFSAGYLAPYLEDSGSISPFSSVGVTERPDSLCGKMMEGRIGILIDGVPSALVVPCIFAEYFQTMDDYSNRPYFAFFTRMLKFAAFFIAMFLPGFYTALGTYDPEMFPTLTLNKIAISIGSTPLSLTAETIMILLVYEIMRESGLRMPQPLGYAVSIVGGLVIGDTAINAGLIGAPTLMVVAISAICSYIIPDLYAPTAVLRIVFSVIGGLFGIWGMAAAMCILFVNLCSKKSFGIPYMSPVTPLGATVLRDVIFRAGWKRLSYKNARVQNMPGAHTEVM